MKYTHVRLAAIGYELAPVVVTSDEIEERLQPLYQKLHLPAGQLAALTGIEERRWWEPDFSLAEGAARAAEKALARAERSAAEGDTLIYAGVCRESVEPATACAVAARLGVSPNAEIYDVSNACLGVMNGILDVANRIELGQIRAGLIVAAETAREIVEVSLEKMLSARTMEAYTRGLATLTGGSGAAAVLLARYEGERGARRALAGGIARNAPEHHGLCRWGLAGAPTLHRAVPLPQEMYTDSSAVLRYGVELGKRTWEAFLAELGWSADEIERVICHQVGASHQDTILKLLGIPRAKDYSTFRHLGNMGTVSLPLTAALAEERGILAPGTRVAFLGIGSGLNCLMLGWHW